MIYLASPYSHSDSKVKAMRFRAACIAAGELIKQGLIVFSPIAHTHPIKMLSGLEGEWQQWKTFDEDIISRCEGLFVLKIDGWEESIGVQAEIEFAREQKIPVEHVRAYSVGLLFKYPHVRTVGQMEELI